MVNIEDDVGNVLIMGGKSFNKEFCLFSLCKGEANMGYSAMKRGKLRAKGDREEVRAVDWTVRV